MTHDENPDPNDAISHSELKSLRPSDISAIERALDYLEAFGEIHLIIESARLRSIRTVKSESVDKGGQSK